MVEVDNKKGELTFSTVKKRANKSLKQASGTKNLKKDENPQKV